VIRVLLADDHAIVREGLRRILSAAEGIAVGGEASNGFDVLAKVKDEVWDLLLLDLSMPGKGGMDLIKQVKAEKPDLPILVLSMHDEAQYAVRALKAGASGYLNKVSAGEALIAAVRKVAGGGVYVSQATAEALARSVMPANQAQPGAALSDREFQVLGLLAAGNTVSAIAQELHLSVKTVSTHKTRVMEKLELRSHTDLVRYAMASGLIDRPEAKD